MTPEKTVLANAFFAKAKFAEVRYRATEEEADRIDTCFQGVTFFIQQGHLERARSELELAQAKINNLSECY